MIEVARGGSFLRMMAILQRQAFLYRRTFHRWLDLFYWPLVDLVLFGFIQLYIQRVSHVAAFFLGAVILWDLLFRSQQAVSVGFLEDVWSRNVLNVWASPIRPAEYIGGTIISGVIRVVVGSTFAVLIASTFYHFNLMTVGVALAPLVIGLAAMGWALGIFATAVMLRFGEGAEPLAWALAFVFQPISAVFYPVSVLPGPLQPVARAVPASHAFAGLRTVLNGGGFPGRAIAITFLLDVIYLFVCSMFFAWMLRQVRSRGLLSRFGE
ncbi:MAG: ABC transporter permease [Actinomycetota bacterium]|nr:ABC transporter permease [Actinomycetota bacterium]